MPAWLHRYGKGRLCPEQAPGLSETHERKTRHLTGTVCNASCDTTNWQMKQGGGEGRSFDRVTAWMGDESGVWCRKGVQLQGQEQQKV